MIPYYVVCDIGYNSLDCDLKDEIIIIHLWFYIVRTYLTR